MGLPRRIEPRRERPDHGDARPSIRSHLPHQSRIDSRSRRSGGRYCPAGARLRAAQAMIVHLVDGTYELFRHFYGARRATNGADSRFGGVRGVLAGVLQMIEKGATHLGVATDHIIESFRNQLWPGYKTGAGIDRVLWSQFRPLEEGLAAMGVAVWPMI